MQDFGQFQDVRGAVDGTFMLPHVPVNQQDRYRD